MTPLTAREKEILCLFDQGKSYKEIAELLQISPHTVRTHARLVIIKCAAVSLRHAAYLQRTTTAATPSHTHRPGTLELGSPRGR